jgi:hypothetical protein
MWDGIFTRVQESTPGPLSPFSFSEATAILSINEKSRSLLLKLYSATKGGLVNSIDDTKSLAKMRGSVPQDFHSFNFQLKAFTIAIGFVFGEDSILVTKLCDFMENVNGKHSIIYKNRITIDNTFATKVLWMVDCFTQIFLKDS